MVLFEKDNSVIEGKGNLDQRMVNEGTRQSTLRCDTLGDIILLFKKE